MSSVYIVSSHYKEDIRWLENYRLPVIVVSKEGGDYLNLNHDKYFNVHLISNKLREAGSYLWFIVNYWNHLPEKMFFIHGHETAYHQKISINEAIERYSDRSYYDFNHFQKMEFISNEKQELFSFFWNSFYGNQLGPPPQKILCERGAQFVVDRSVIKMHPISFYRRAYDTACSLSKSKDFDYKIGVFFEITWHIIFRQKVNEDRS